MDKKRYEEIDILKGIAILMVMMGHSFSTAPINIYADLPIFGSFVREFQMPLFFIASGFLFSSKDSFVQTLRKKGVRLILPYVTFSLLLVSLRVLRQLMIGGGIDYNQILGLFTGENYWFLYSLFLTMVICSFSQKTIYLITICILAMILIASTNVVNISVCTVGRTVYYIPFFIVGNYIRSIYRFLNRINMVPITIAAFSSTIIFYFIFEPSLRLHLDLQHYPVKFVGCILTWAMSLLVMKSGLLLKFFGYFGRYSLQYYLNHQLFIAILFVIVPMIGIIKPVTALFSIFILAVGISSIMLLIEQKVPVLSLICGLRKHNKHENR